MTAKLNNAGSVCRNLHRPKKNQNLPGILPELSRTMAYTTRNTVNRLAFKQLHLYHVVPEQLKGGINLYIELEKHTLDQIAARNIRMSLEKYIAFSKKKKSYGVSEKKNATNICDSNLPTVPCKQF